MLVLTRKEGEQIRIGDDIIVTVVRSGGDKIRLGIEAPAEISILRSELKTAKRKTATSDATLEGESASEASVSGKGGLPISYTELTALGGMDVARFS